MSLNEFQISPDELANYLTAQGILDKNTVKRTLDEFKKSDISSYPTFLVKKRIMQEGNLLKILEKLAPTEDSAPAPISDPEHVFDEDIKEIYNSIKDDSAEFQAEVDELIDPGEKLVDKLSSQTGIDWQGRRMTDEDKETLVKKIAEMKANKEISSTNGAFVHSWMNKLLDS